MSETHELKCAAPFFDAIHRGDKNFEVRRDDRGFQRGDEVVLIRMDPDHPSNYAYPKTEIRRFISFILTGGQFGIDGGYVVLALTPKRVKP